MIFLFLPNGFCKSKKKPDTFKEVEQLFNEKEYSSALLQLAQLLNNSPENFDDAQKYISQIMKNRKIYYDFSETLLHNLREHPENAKLHLDMIEQLEEMEKNPNKITKAFLRQVKSAAQFTYYKAQFEQIMQDGKNLLVKKKYLESAKKFQEGFSLYQEEYFAENTKPEYVEPVKKGLETIAFSINNFTSYYLILKESIENYEKVLQTGIYNNILISHNNVFTNFSNYAKLRNDIAQAGNTFHDIFNILSHINSELTEASFLPFAYRFTLGRVNDPLTGILAVFDSIWEEKMPVIKYLAQNNAMNSLNGLINFLKKKDFIFDIEDNDISQSTTAINNTLNFFNLANNAERLDSLRQKPIDENFSQNIDFAQYIANGFLKEIKTAEFLGKQINEANAFNFEQKNYAEKMILMAQTFHELSQKSFENLNLIKKEFEKANTLQNETKNAYEQYINFVDKIAQTAKIKHIEQWNILAQNYEIDSVNILNNYTNIFTQASDLLNIDNKRQYTFPKESIEVINLAYKTLDKDYNKILQEKNILLTAPETDVKNDKNTAQQYHISLTKIDECLITLDSLKKQSQEMLEIAQKQIVQATRAQNEAELRYNEALQALKRENFQTARDSLQRARTKYSEALALQENPALRQTSDNILQQLGFDINKAENEIVVKDVRRLTTNAKEEYYNGNFENAESLLVQAKTRWHTTNIEEDPEITSLYTLVNTALSMKTGRVIPPTAPLYPEMSQLLNIANQNYDEGKKLIKQNNMTKAKIILNDAKEKINQVKLVYPINQEASLLSLRIDQLIDPISFNTTFAQKVQIAKNDINKPDKRQNAYTDLLDLYEINPKYPGLKNDIYNAEIKLGIRVPPPNIDDLNKAKKLTSEALALINKTNRTEIELNTAMAKVNEALRLNPDDKNAMQTKDRLSSLIGGTLSVVLSAADEETYNLAIQELSRGNTIQASALVAQLLQKKQNQNSSKILDLKRKVDSLL
ncbi:MAG: hypothetical protein GX220_09560 [Treponema sp.]|nr:hypothetical protein [Treponema sp.]